MHRSPLIDNRHALPIFGCPQRSTATVLYVENRYFYCIYTSNSHHHHNSSHHLHIFTYCLPHLYRSSPSSSPPFFLINIIMSTAYTEREARLAEAVEYAQSLEQPVLAAIAKQHDVCRMTLTRRLEGHLSRSSRLPTNRKMTQEMENALKRFCQTLEQMGVAVTVKQLRKAALSMFKGVSQGEKFEVTLGVNWIERFVKRNELFTVTQKSREVARVVATDPKVIRSYFQDFRKTREKYGILVRWIFHSRVNPWQRLFILRMEISGTWTKPGLLSGWVGTSGLSLQIPTLSALPHRRRIGKPSLLPRP